MSGPDFYDYNLDTGDLTPVFITGRRPAGQAPAGLAAALAEACLVWAEAIEPVRENIVAVCREFHDQLYDIITAALAALAPSLTAPAYAVDYLEPSIDFPPAAPDSGLDHAPASADGAKVSWLRRFLEDQAWTGIGAIASILAALLTAVAILQAARNAEDQPVDMPVRYEAPQHEPMQPRPPLDPIERHRCEQ